MDSSGVGPITPAVKLIKSVSKLFLDPSKKQIDKTQHDAAVNTSLQKNERLSAKIDETNEKFPSVEALLPVKILASPLLMRSEWAWKRLLATALETSDEQLADTRGDAAISSASNHVQRAENVEPTSVIQNGIASSQVNTKYEAALKVLWSILADVSDENRRDSWRTTVQDLHSKGSIVEFSQLHHGDINQLPPVARQWMIEDRLISSVQMDSYELIGQGLFLLPSQSGRTEQVAHRFHARKQTRITGRGKLVHRIQFDIRVNDKPVRCTIISAKPSLLVHFDTNDILLEKHLTRGQERVAEVLKNEGWQLMQWSVSDFSEDKGAVK
jgi:hypothetical protein